MHVPLPHVFPPFAIRQSPTGRELDAIDFVAIAIPSLRSLRRAPKKKPPSDEEGGHILDMFALDLSVQNKKITKKHSFLVFFHILLIDIVPP